MTPLLHSPPGARWIAEEALRSEAGLDQVLSTCVSLAAGETWETLGRISQEHVATRGKQLRARLALASLEALGSGRGEGLAWAAACELLHNASLIHDDLQDGDALRRGRPAVWARHGRVQAINAGDLLLVLPTRAIARVPRSGEVRWRLAELLSARAEQTVRGQSREQLLLDEDDLSWEGWRRAVEGKTAALFTLPVEGAGLIHGLDPAESGALGDSVRPLGVLFQLQDDVLDLFGDKGRGQVGSDLREGRVSALVAAHVQRHPEDRDWLVDLLRTPRGATTDVVVAAAGRRFRAAGTLDWCWDRIGMLAAEVLGAEALYRHPRMHAVATAAVALALAPIQAFAPEVALQGVAK